MKDLSYGSPKAAETAGFTFDQRNWRGPGHPCIL